MKASRLALAALGCGFVLGCGSDAEPIPAPASQNAAPAASADRRNQPPVFRTVRIEPDEFMPGDLLNAVVEVSDPDADALALSYRWNVDGERHAGDAPNMQLPESAVRARVELEVVAVDGRGGRSQYTARADAQNRAPELTHVLIEPGYEIRAGSELVASFRGVDPDGDPIEFVHTWLVDNRRSEVVEARLAPRHFARGDVVTLEVYATDGSLDSPSVTSRPIQVVNTAPVITSTPAGFDTSGAFDYRVAVSDPDGDRLHRFRLLKAPPGMTIDWLNGSVHWSPADQQTGRHTVEIEVDDQHGGVVTQSFAVEVADEPAAKATPAAPAS